MWGCSFLAMTIDDLIFSLNDDQIAAVVANLDIIHKWELQLAKDAKGQVHKDTAALLQALIATLQPEDDETEETAVNNDAEISTTKKKGKRGWVELKTINGCGPYAYRRWREGGRLRSEYVGKVEK